MSGVVKVGGAMITAPKMNADLPAHLQQGGRKGLESIGKYVVPPRLKVVQRQAMQTLLDKFTPGDVIVMPSMDLMYPVLMGENGRPTTNGTPFHFVPLFFYPEWIVWNPMEAKGTLSAIRERTLDPTSNIAIRSKSASTWSMQCPEVPQKDNKPLFCRFVEHLNFVIKPLMKDCPLGDQYTIMSFARGEHRAGTKFAGLIQSRNANAIFGCQFEGRVAQGPDRSKGDNTWLGIDVMNPSAESEVDPWVQSAEDYKQYELLHEALSSAHKDGLLQATYDDDAVEGTASPAGTAAETKY